MNIETKEITNVLNVPFDNGFIPDVEYKAELHINNENGEKSLHDIQDHQIYMLDENDEMNWINVDKESTKKLIEENIEKNLKDILYDW